MKTIKNKIVYEENINNIQGKAIAIVFPESEQEIKNVIKIGNHDVIARGSGSSFTGAVIPKDSIIIDFSKMNKIIELSASNKTVIVEPGVLLSELNEELEQYNLEFPIEPLFGGLETIGGMIAKNAAGNKEIKYNRMLNWIDSLEVINGNGEHVHVSKSDLGDFVGMEGTTGIIMQAKLRLTHRRTRSLTILKSNNLMDIFVLNRKLRMNMDVSSIDLINPEISVFLGLEKKYHLFIELEHDRGNFRGENYRKYIKLKNNFYKKAAMEGYWYMSNAKFLIESLQDFLIYLEENNIPYLGQLASGVVYPLFKPEQVSKIEEAAKFAKRLRGRVAYNFGIGLTKKDFLDIGEADLIRRIKKRHDPHDKLNRNKLIESKFKAEPISEKEEKEQQKDEEVKEAVAQTVGDIIAQSETMTLKKQEPELSEEEREKIKKIASGFFAGGGNSA